MDKECCILYQQARVGYITLCVLTDSSNPVIPSLISYVSEKANTDSPNVNGRYRLSPMINQCEMMYISLLILAKAHCMGWGITKWVVQSDGTGEGFSPFQWDC